MNQNHEEIKEILQNEPENPAKEELLTRLAANSEKQLFYARLRTLILLAAVAVMVLCLVMIVPAVLRSIYQADELMDQVSETLALADQAIASVTEMSDSITEIGENMDTFLEDNAENAAGVMEKIEAVDFEGLNKAIRDLGDVVEPIAKLFNKF